VRGRKAAALTVGLALIAPGAALAQSAGDDQYRDPFGEDEQPQQDPGSSGDTGGGDTGSSTPAPAPAPAPAETPTGAEPTATTAAELPRTGLGAGLLAGLGFLLVAAGAALRRGTDRPDRV
jgi:hypothetical protein